MRRSFTRYMSHKAQRWREGRLLLLAAAEQLPRLLTRPVRPQLWAPTMLDSPDARLRLDDHTTQSLLGRHDVLRMVAKARRPDPAVDLGHTSLHPQVAGRLKLFRVDGSTKRP